MKGMIYMGISALFFSVMALLLKILYQHSLITAYEITYWQSLFMTIVQYGMMRGLKKDPYAVPQGLRMTLILRNITGFIGITGYYLAIQYTDLSKAAVLYWTNPMFTAVIAYIWLKETLTLIDWAAIFTSFAGIIIIQNPLSTAEVAKEFSILDSKFDTIGGISAIVGALFTAISLM